MSIRTVLSSDSPNEGRIVWNQNDQQLEFLIDSFGLNVRSSEFGAVGDGNADDGPAMQKAIDQCSTNGGGNVFLPPGSYRLKTGSLMLRDGVNLIGAGSQVTHILLGDQLNQPVITDTSFAGESNYAFGVVRLAHFSVDGGRDQNPSTSAAIATTAYYSVFEDITVANCSGHGIWVGGAQMTNYASQNQFLGCRISDCGQAALYFDINAVDSVVSNCFIHTCRYGIYINNGGMRIVNNVVFDHSEAGMLITQTALSGLIAMNDFNSNHRGNIVISRTTASTTEKWSQVLIGNNVILGDALDSDGAYDAILITSDVPTGIAKVSIIGNKIYAPEGVNRFRYGVRFDQNIIQSSCLANDVDDCAAGAYYIDPSCADIQIAGVQSIPVDTPDLPSSGSPLQNTSGVPVTVYLTGGGGTKVLIGAADTGLTAGTFRLSAGQTITIFYTQLPSWKWFAE